MLLVIPAWDTLILHQADMSAFIDRFRALQEGGTDGDAALEELMVGCMAPEARSTAFCREDRFTTRREIQRLVALTVAAHAGE